jgi:hypothetical protein
MTMASSAETLQKWAQEKQLSQASLSDDGSKLTLGDVTLEAVEKITVVEGDRSCEYSLASMFLQVVAPDQSLVAYRGACKKHKVGDPVKASDKATVVSFFLGSDSTGGADPTAPALTDNAPAEVQRDEDRQERQRREKDRHKDKRDKKKRVSSSDREKKKQKKTIDSEKLFSNLQVVVGKRAQTLEQSELQKALNPEGFVVTPEVLSQYKEQAQTILSWEIPVGNSASILQAAAGKDLSHILKLYNDIVNPSKAQRSSSKGAKTFRQHLVGKKPVIILPKGMTAPITLVNANEFFGNAKFVPRDVLMKQGKVNKHSIATTFSRKVSQRHGGGTVEYELMDNPKTKLQTAQDWQRVVAVVALGAGWQFKDWPGEYSNPVHLFGKTFGFYIGMEGDKTPAELEGWSVTKAHLNRDKRGLDSVTYASFWNGLDEFMAIHAPEMLPQTNN